MSLHYMVPAISAYRELVPLQVAKVHGLVHKGKVTNTQQSHALVAIHRS